MILECALGLQLSVVYKFGGSSVATADRMREVAAIVCSFPEHAPLVVLSAMGKVCPPPQPLPHVGPQRGATAAAIRKSCVVAQSRINL